MEVDERQVHNNVDGFVWEVDDITRLRRFLVLGSELPTYYIEEEDLGQENARSILNLIQAGRGVDVVKEIFKYSTEGRTVKQQPIMLALAMCARLGDLPTKQSAYEIVPKVCRTPTHLFMFVGYCKTLSAPSTGWGRAHRNAMKKWYLAKEPMKLAMDITKYQKREGWSHRDVARLMHLKPDGVGINDELFAIMKYIVRGWNEVTAWYFQGDRSVAHRCVGEGTNTVLEFLRAVETVKRLTVDDDESQIVQLIVEHNLVREHIPTACLNSIEVIIYRFISNTVP